MRAIVSSSFAIGMRLRLSRAATAAAGCFFASIAGGLWVSAYRSYDNSSEFYLGASFVALALSAGLLKNAEVPSSRIGLVLLWSFSVAVIFAVVAVLSESVASVCALILCGTVAVGMIATGPPEHR